MQLLAAGLIADPRSAALLLDVYQALDRGAAPSFEHIPVRWLPDNFVEAGKPVHLEGMPIAMDIASGMTAERRSKVSKQAKTAILGAYLDFALVFDGVAPKLDLGDAFRAKPKSDVPVLVLSGTLDGRTDIESQREAVSELRNVTVVTVKNAGHNLIDEHSGQVQEAIDQFLERKPVYDATVTIDLPDMVPKTDAH
jgi:pimeloyl-ACP methyl ester carboxylesterase